MIQWCFMDIATLAKILFTHHIKEEHGDVSSLSKQVIHLPITKDKYITTNEVNTYLIH